ncbi:MFS transporter [Actinoalloteichus hymeniacidonis]|uniref:Fucose permease n=1 Tax=Actinoalloteichus hymeniacidonis TaxID=340345 RepID=A0AAC9HR82_9PSEU|nr:MFS transporter [Actinoalloteichus hymeniacidonis]AOS64099.1 fucose permease [Actinoalloteichus hymeniacidonis]MBB5907837.1 MFS family permease [Actinoalloteichus hymeniacidonis]
MAHPIAQRRLALFVLFFLPGIGISSWVTRTPAIRDLLDASTAQMGLVLFGLSVGSMVGILSAGPLVKRTGARPIIVLGISSFVLSMPTIGLGSALSMPLLVAAGLCLFGLGMGAGEVAMNVEGADVEKALGKPFLPALHGCFSLGTVVGAAAGIVFTATEFSVVWHLLIVGAIAFAAFALVIRAVPPGTGRSIETKPAEGTVRRGPVLWRDSRLLLIGGIMLAVALTEGTANDWLPLIMVDGHGFDAELGSAIYAAFAAAMTVGRFVGGRIVERVGRSRVLGGSAVLGVLGLALVMVVDNQIVAGAAVVLWGLGTSLGFPVALSAAGDSGPDTAARVSFVATVGYVAFLVGPPVLGFFGEEFGLRAALILPMVLLAAAVFLSPAAGPRRGDRTDERMESA